MPDSAITPNVFIDTEVFDAQGLDFTSPNFKRLIRLAAADKVKLFLTTVTRGEINRHLDEHAKKAFKQISDYRRAMRIVKKVIPPETIAALETIDVEAFRNDLNKDFMTFLEKTAAEILPINEVSSDAIFQRYFEQEPPFGDKHKKNEFPMHLHVQPFRLGARERIPGCMSSAEIPTGNEPAKRMPFLFTSVGWMSYLNNSRIPLLSRQSRSSWLKEEKT